MWAGFRVSFLLLGLSLSLAVLAGCSQPEEQRQNLLSEISEAAWLGTCASRSSLDDPSCSDRQVMWVVTLQEGTDPGHLIAQLGPRNGGMRVEVDLRDTTTTLDEELHSRTFFLSGNASLGLSAGRRPLVHVQDAEIIGFQTQVQGPRQGSLAAELTMAEFGRYCLLAPEETYTEQCAGKRVVWYGLLRGAANDGVMLGLPFDEANLARIKTAEPLTWPVGNTSVLSDSPVVIEGILAAEIAHTENGQRVPIVNEAHIISFARRQEPLVEITGIE